MEKKNRLIYRFSFVVIGLFLLGIGIGYKIIHIQLVEGDSYKLLAEKTTVQNFQIEPIRGNIYAHDGSLLATSVPRYTIHFDAATVTTGRLENNVDALADSLASLLGIHPIIIIISYLMLTKTASVQTYCKGSKLQANDSFAYFSIVSVRRRSGFGCRA